MSIILNRPAYEKEEKNLNSNQSESFGEWRQQNDRANERA